MSADYQFGIDLGTTNSAIARSNGVEIRSYQSNEQMTVTPSAVRLHKNGRLMVGRRASSALMDDPDNLATEFKRLMGKKVSKAFPCCGRSMSPEELSAEILKSLKDDVRRQTGEEITQAVITVPAAFGTLQCEATSRAASLAGISETYLLQEPIAAAVAYGVGSQSRDKRWLVFDLGGGTLDIAVISTRGGQLTVLENRGNNLLGGKDMDRIIVDQIFFPALEGEFELPEPGSPERLRLVRRLLGKAEETKIDLSTSEQVTVSLFDLGDDSAGKSIEIELAVTRAEFEDEIKPLVETCIRTAQEALAAARLPGSDIDRILLVGGPTQIPYIRAALTHEIGAQIDCSIDPMTVVSRGAAIFAASVGWKGTPIPSTTSDNGKLAIKLGYDKVSAEIQTQVTGSVSRANVIEAIRIDADGGFWTSGWTPLTNGTFNTNVQLLEGQLTDFWIYARRAGGTLVDVEPDSLSIRHGLVPSAPPLPHSICVEIEKPDGTSELDVIFPKGYPLPAEKPIRYRAARTLLTTQLDECLAMKLWEGETKEDPPANEWVGAMAIFGRSIKVPIREGAEIQFTVRVDESRRISVDAFLPGSNNTISDMIYVPDREQGDPNEKVRDLPASIENLYNRLDNLELATDRNEDSLGSEEIYELRTKLDEAHLRSSEPADFSGDPDYASRSLDEERRLRARVAALERVAGSAKPAAGEAVRNARQDANAAREIAEKFGSETEKRELTSLMRGLEQAVVRDDARSIRKAGEHLQSLRWRVLFNQNWFWKDSLATQQIPGRRFVNKQEAEKWLTAGETAVQSGDSSALKEAVRHLWKLQPKSDVDVDQERAMRAGLRKF